MNRPLRPVLALIALALSTSAYDTPFLTTADMQVHYSDTKGLIRSEGGATLFVHDRIDSVLVGGKKLVIAERGDNWVKVDLPAGEHAVEVTLGDRAGNYPIRLTPAPEKRPLVRTPSELAKALAAAAPGSEVIIANGVYNGWRVSFTSDGTAGQPVTIRPQTPGGVTFRLHCELRIKADHVVFKGFRFEHCERTVLRIEGGSHNRITQCQFLYCGSPGSTFGHILSIYPDSHHSRVDHCYWTGSKAMSLGIRAPGDKASCPTHNRLDHNVFRDVYRIWINGQENIQLGQGKHSHKQSLHTLVEYNLFHHAWGDGEIFSSKTSHNTFRHNVAAHCPRAAFTLRGGNHATVDGNIMVGNGNGVRIFGCDHAIINNLIAGSQSSAIHFYSHNQGA
ncbi:MAG: hypothetical protein HON70_43635, partial [Lentisphaerae bacterium]|nr:hypothetical protein [Lentisphaerota bacterium]